MTTDPGDADRRDRLTWKAGDIHRSTPPPPQPGAPVEIEVTDHGELGATLGRG